MAHTKVAATKRKIGGGPLECDFTRELRELRVSALHEETDHPEIRVVFHPFHLTQTVRYYALTDFKKRSKHEQEWLVEGKLPA